MPDVTDSPDGVHPHLKVDFVSGHPDGEIRLWVKQRFHVMGPAEARALINALEAEITRHEARHASPTPLPPQVAPEESGAHGLFVG